MISWEDAKKSIGEEPTIPAQTYLYYAYKKGQVEMFPDMVSAKNFSPNVEKVCTNEDVRVLAKSARNTYNQQVYSYWYGRLQLEYPDLTNRGIFEAVFNYARDNAMGDGYDAIADELENLDVLMDKVFEAYHSYQNKR